MGVCGYRKSHQLFLNLFLPGEGCVVRQRQLSLLFFPLLVCAAVLLYPPKNGIQKIKKFPGLAIWGEGMV